jgi:AhpD family alkylhydroperoxidase
MSQHAQLLRLVWVPSKKEPAMPDTLAAFDQHRPCLYGIAYRMLGSRADAEDMVQEACLRSHHSDVEEVRAPNRCLILACKHLTTKGDKAMTTRLNALKVTPNGVAALVNVENYVKASGLDHRLIALVKTRVSQINGCAYCLHMHTEEARKLGETPTRLYLLDAWHESNLYSDRERAALAWAESLTNISTTHAPDEVYEQARRQFNEKELADLSIAIAMINAWNRLSIGMRAAHPSDMAKAA